MMNICIFELSNTNYLKPMKKIEAIIRKTKFLEVKEELFKRDIVWFSYAEVRGVGMSTEDRIYRGVMYDTDIIERYMLTIVVRDELAQVTIDTILEFAYTGNVGDGRIIVSDILDLYRIRTKEHGKAALAVGNTETKTTDL